MFEYLSPCSLGSCLFIDFLWHPHSSFKTNFQAETWPTVCLIGEFCHHSQIVWELRGSWPAATRTGDSVTIYVKRRTTLRPKVPRVFLTILNYSTSSPCLLSMRNSFLTNSSKYFGYFFLYPLTFWNSDYQIIATYLLPPSVPLVSLRGLLFLCRC